MANKPNNPSLWSRAKSMAKSKFDVYPSAYANGWAAKYYKSKGGTWRKGEKGMIMQGGGMSGNIPVKRMKTKTVTVSPSGDYKTIEKQELTPRGTRGSFRTRRTMRGVLRGVPRANDSRIYEKDVPLLRREADKEDNSYYETENKVTSMMRSGGVNNPGFKSLPGYVQAKIRANMQGGGMAVSNPMMMPVVQTENYNMPSMDMIDQASNGLTMFREGGMPDRYKKMGFRGVNQPKRTPGASKSHAVVTKVGGDYKLIRFGQQGVTGSPEGSKRNKAFKARHAKNIAKGKSSAAYWANKIKW